LVFGSPHPKALDLLRVSGAATIPETSQAEGRYRTACALLRQRGSHVLDAVEMFVVHEQTPQWLLEGCPSAARARLIDGLGILRDWYKGARHRAA
jgi:hypothetical protein